MTNQINPNLPLQNPTPISETISQPVASIPPVIESTQSIAVPQQVSEPPKKSIIKKYFVVFLVFFFLLSIAGSVYGAYAIAYEKIKLDKYSVFQEKVSAFVISLPFMPKTPKYLLAKSAYTHQSVTKESFDVSIAVDSKDIASALGISGLDMSAKGAVDYSDPKNIKASVNGAITKDFNFDFIKLDKILYFKINKLPQLLLTGFGLKSDEFDSMINKWVSCDTTPLATEARKSIEDKEIDPLSKRFVDEELQKYLDEKVLSKMKVENVNEDGFDVYKVTLVADAELIDYLGRKLESEQNKVNGSSLNVLGANTNKLSDIVKSLSWQINIDKKDFYTRKVIIKADIEGDSLDTGGLMLGTATELPKNARAKIALAAKFSDFGKEINTEKPSSSITWEQFLNLGAEIVQKKYSLPSGSLAPKTSSSDSIRMSSISVIQHALELYNADNEKYPRALSELKGSYFTEVPKNPDGSEYYYKASNNGKSYELCANLDYPKSRTSNTCSDTKYNTGYKNP